MPGKILDFEAQKGAIEVTAGTQSDLKCQAVIFVPDSSLLEAGHIQTLNSCPNASSKHDLYALMQTVLFRFQDKDLTIEQIQGAIKIHRRKKDRILPTGMVICRTLSGKIVVLSSSNEPHRRLIEAANRYLTRWIRLDI